MDAIIVGIIIAGALVFTIRGFVKMVKGEGSCSCGEGCSCSSKESCSAAFPAAKNK
jgi:FeoB-associated Cys-rich membrane protein